jgi:AcrR family transcriptional regulator
MVAMSRPDPAPKRGRPRDEDAERRLLSAALEVYGERGWYGLTANEVIRRANVGKTTFYMRWSNVGDLLYQAFDEVLLPMRTEDSSATDIRDLLLTQGRLMAGLYLAPARVAFVRAMAESEVGPPAVRRVRDEVFMKVVRHTRTRVSAAISAHDLPHGMSATNLLELFEGAIFMHFTSGLGPDVRPSADEVEAYVEQLTDQILTLVKVDA